MNRLLIHLLGALLVVFAFTACDDGGGGNGGQVGDPCDSDEDCAGDLQCGDDNRCFDPAADADGDADSDSDGDGDGDGDGDVDGDSDADGDEVPPPDQDGDGVSDECEESWEGMDAHDFDSDDDGLPDGVEDANSNCIVDDGETDPTNPDSDGDGIPDGVERRAPGLCVGEFPSSCAVDCPAICGDGLCTHGETIADCDADCDGICGDGRCVTGETAGNCGADCPEACDDGFCTHTETGATCPGDCYAACGDGTCTPQRRDPFPLCEETSECAGGEECVFLDPLDPDIDDDGLLDGEEDFDHDGLIEVENGETEPRLDNTDGDGTPDLTESAPAVCNTDELIVPTEHDSERGDYTVAVDPSLTDGRDLVIAGLSAGDVHAGTVADGYDDGLAVFVLSKPPTAGVGDAFAQDSADEAFMDGLSGLTFTPLLNRQPFETHDGFLAVTSQRLVDTSAAMTPGALRDQLVDELTGRAGDTVVPPATAGPYTDATSTEFVLRITTVWRSDRVMLLGAVALQSANDDISRSTWIKARDFANTTGLAQYGYTLGAECDTFEAGVQPMADFIWVVDTSGSIVDDVERIADAADQFFETLERSGIDYRVGVRAACLADLDPVMSLVVPSDTDPPYGPDSNPFTRDPLKFGARIQDSGGWVTDICENPLGAARIAYEWLQSHPLITVRTTPEDLAPGLRPDALTIVVVVTDEEENEVANAADGGLNCSLERIEASARVVELTEWFNNPGPGDGERPIMVFGMISPAYTDADGDPATCGGTAPADCTLGGSDSVAARSVIRASGGSEAPICSADPTEEITEATINAMVEVAQGAASNYLLERIPISSTLRLALRGRVAPRSRRDGFDYDNVNNAVLFHYTSHSSPWRPVEGDEFAVSYRFWVERTADQPDLVAFELSPDMSECTSGVVHLSGRFGNLGAEDVPAGVRVSFYRGSPLGSHTLIATVPTADDLPVGFDGLWVSAEFHPPAWDERYDLYVTIDDVGDGTGLIDESDEENNTAFLLDVGCAGII